MTPTARIRFNVASCLASLVGVFLAGPLSGAQRAVDEDPVPLAYRYVGVSQGVPYRILYCIALTESGMSVPEKGYIPWPWTLNIRGNPARFETREAAIKALVLSLDAGIENIDIGEAQINYHYNGTLLPSIEQAFDTDASLRAATRVLQRELAYCETTLARSDWWCAVERYHSPGPSQSQRERAIRYAGRVQGCHERLLP